jgi:anti-sigma factor RsiW
MSEPNERRGSYFDEELIAYLDGELDAEATSRFDARLAEDVELRQRVQQHRRTWELLDELPRTDVDDRFTQTTVEMVAVSVADQVESAGHHDSLRAKIGWLIGGVVAVAASLAGYALVASIVAAPNRQLVEDLRVIENLDAYRAVEDIEFLRALEREGLFSVEVVDGL